MQRDRGYGASQQCLGQHHQVAQRQRIDTGLGADVGVVHQQLLQIVVLVIHAGIVAARRSDVTQPDG